MYSTIQKEDKYTDILFSKYPKILKSEKIEGIIISKIANHPLKGDNNRFVEIDTMHKFVVVKEFGAINSDQHIDLNEVLKIGSKSFKNKESDSLFIEYESTKYTFILKNL
jgi:hypothetical protein